MAAMDTAPGTRHLVQVKAVNRRTEAFPRRNRRGRTTGTDHRTVCDGYRPECSLCGPLGEATPYKVKASAQAARHADEHPEGSR